MDTETTTNPVEEADTSQDTGAPEAEVETTEPQLDDQGNPIEPEQPEAEEEEEIELDEDLKLKLPKSQAEKLRQAALRQADYTRKTQELAESRKAFEAERETFQQADAQEWQARGQLALIDQQLAQYAQVDWRAWQQSDPFAAQEAFTQFQLLKDGRTQAERQLGQIQQDRTLRTQQETAKRLQEGAAELARDIKDWSPAHAAKLLDHGQKQYGFSKEDLDGIDDPRLIKVLDAAFRWHEHQASQKKAQAAQKQQQVQPAAKVGGTTPRTGLSDNLSTEEWVRRRNEQVRKRA